MANWLNLINAIATIIMIFLSSLLLWLTAKYFFKLKDTAYKTALIVAAIVGAVVGLLGSINLYIDSTVLIVISLLVEMVLGLFLIKRFYKLEWNKTALVWLVWFVLNIIVTFIMGLIISLAIPLPTSQIALA